MYAATYRTVCYGWRVGIVKSIVIVTATACAQSDLYLPYLTLSYHTFPNLTQPYLTLPCLVLPHPTLPYLTLPHPALHYPTLL